MAYRKEKLEEVLDEILPEAFAIIKETAKRFKENEEIEVVSINILNGSSYNIQLPVGDYTLVASTFGEPTIEFTINITAGSDIEQHIDL